MYLSLQLFIQPKKLKLILLYLRFSQQGMAGSTEHVTNEVIMDNVQLMTEYSRLH